MKVPAAVNRMYACDVGLFMTTPAVPEWVSTYVLSGTPLAQDRHHVAADPPVWLLKVPAGH